jgi:hypothetical protein
MLEKTIEKNVTKYAKDKGWLSFKFVSPSNRGVPDRIFMKGGRTIFIEFKASGKKPTKLQWRRIEQIEKAGLAVFVVDSVEDGREIISALA